VATSKAMLEAPNVRRVIAFVVVTFIIVLPRNPPTKSVRRSNDKPHAAPVIPLELFPQDCGKFDPSGLIFASDQPPSARASPV
jgi:hypothetical protein